MTADSPAARIAELEDSNRRLRRLLDQRDAPGELRHRLRSTLALLRTVIRKSAATDRDREDYIAHLEDRIDAIARAQAVADQHGEIDLHDLLIDELFRYGVSEGERLVLSGPIVRLRPRAGQVFTLAAHELAVNAVEHGPLGAGDGRLKIVWMVAATEPGSPLTLNWTETGSSIIAASAHQGFGTEVLTRTLAYEFKAQTSLLFEPDGLHCSIRFPLGERIGRLAG